MPEVNNAGETHKYRAEIFMILGEIIVIVLFAIFTEYKGMASPHPDKDHAFEALEQMQDRYALF